MAEEASTRFPFINLKKALERAKLIFDGDKTGKPMAITTAFELWGYSQKSSGGFQTIGALKGYGLLVDEGANEDRRVRLTEKARHYFLDERDEVRTGMLVDFALSPTLFRVLWRTDKWSEGVPADTVARSHLKITRHLNEQSARAVLSMFKENMVFAGLKAGDEVEQRVESEQSDTGSAKAQPEKVWAPPPMEQVVKEQMDRYATPAAPAASQTAGMMIKPGDIDARIFGDRVVILADVDLRGLRKLKKLILKYEEILTIDDDEEDGTAAN